MGTETSQSTPTHRLPVVGFKEGLEEGLRGGCACLRAAYHCCSSGDSKTVSSYHSRPPVSHDDSGNPEQCQVVCLPLTQSCSSLILHLHWKLPLALPGPLWRRTYLQISWPSWAPHHVPLAFRALLSPPRAPC